MKASQKETELNHLRAEIDALKAQLATLDYEKDEVNNSKGNGKSITKAAKTKKLKQLADTHSKVKVQHFMKIWRQQIIVSHMIVQVVSITAPLD